MNHTERFRHICIVEPWGNPYAQARQLLDDGVIGGRYVLIPVWDKAKETSRLYHSLDTMVMRRIKDCRSCPEMPSGIITVSLQNFRVRRNYLRGGESGPRLPITHIIPVGNPKRQARQIMRSGLASNRYLVLRGLIRGKVTELQVQNLIEYLDQEVMMSCAGIRRNALGVPPLGLILYTSKALMCLNSYNGNTTIPMEET